jgi:hypothetical protein
VSLTEIIQEIERRAQTREIGRLQEIRQELKGHAHPAGHSIFTAQSIFEGNGYAYAFHHGGRTELQFNVGFEPEGFGTVWLSHWSLAELCPNRKRCCCPVSGGSMST